MTEKTSTKTTEEPRTPAQALQDMQAALTPQEGAFMRGVSLILNDPKDDIHKPHRGGADHKSKQVLGLPTTDNERIAGRLLDRNSKGQFVSAKVDEKDPLWKL